MAVQTLEFELRYRKEGRSKSGRDKMVRDIARYSKLPDVPPQFSVTTGNYKRVSDVAHRLNEAQLRGDFLDYLFFPEVATAPKGAEPIGADDV